METLGSSCSATIPSSYSPFFNFSPRKTFPPRPSLLPLVSKNYEHEGGPESDSKDISIVPIVGKRNLSLSPLSKDAAMGLVVGAATGRGWTTGSGMEGPPASAGDGINTTENVSTFPWSLFTKSPRRRMLVAFTCNICGQRTTRAINPHAYTDGTVFVQCCGCNAFHKLVDNLNLFHEMKCYISPSFNYRGNGWEDINIGYMGMEGNGDIFPTQ